MKLAGKAALVAGGGQGIGEGIARCLAEEGADVAIADISRDHARKAADFARTLGRRTLAISVDLTQEGMPAKAVREAADFFGKIDILVNNVGGVTRDMLAQTIEHRMTLGSELLPPHMNFNGKIWDRYYELNLKSHVLLSQAATPYFIRQRSGRIINIASVSGRNGEPGHMPYAAMKAADISITWSLARALAPHDVTVNCICPGFVYTPLWEMGAGAQQMMLREAREKGSALPPGIVEDDVDKMSPRELWLKYLVLPNTPLGREQTAEDMGRAAVFFASDEARNITGQVLHVDGGMTMR